MRTSFSTLALCLFAFAVPASSVYAQASAPVVKKSSEKVAKELEAVKKAVGKAACSSNDQCKSVAMGAKACGGPEFFLPWSSNEADAGKIPELAARHRAAREAQILAEGEMSDCKVVTDPGAQCVAKKCVLKPVGKAGEVAS